MAQDVQTEPDQPGIPVSSHQGPTDPQKLETFLDGVFAEQMEVNNIPGATVVVVKDGELFFTKGYGYADLEKRIPVDPNETIFRLGSVSKLFTWTAVMQLAEQGKLDLNTDINTYLTKFKIPDTYPEPITLAHLMTHTSGFEERITGLTARGPEDIEPMGEYLAANMPARVRPPGEFTSYSNYGAGLAGYIVEEVSGMPFEDYIEENVYMPLDMQHSTFRQPLPPELAPDMTLSYSLENGVYRADEFEHIKGLYPAGSASATAVDMAKFMIAHLQNGRYENNSILQEATVQEMHSQHFTYDPRINGVCYGFYEGSLNNQRIIEHRGAIGSFNSYLVLLPEQNVGLFVSSNSAGGIKANDILKQEFFDRYYPVPDSPAQKLPADFQHRAKLFTGSYGTTRSSYTTYEKLLGLMGGVEISATESHLLLNSKQFVKVEPLVFNELGGQEILVFREDSKGRITHMFSSKSPTMAFVKLEWYEAPMFHFILLGVSMVFFLSALIAWPVIALYNRLKKFEVGTLRTRQARWVAWGMSALYVLFLVGMVIILSDIYSIFYSVPPLLPFVLVLPLVAAVLTIGSLGFTVLAWRKRYWGVAGRVHYTLVTLASLGFMWFLNYWNLLGFRF